MHLNLICEITFGSHLYGTSTIASDTDIKAVYLPARHDILLQKIKPTISITRSKEKNEKNTAEDIDFEAYSISKFLQLLAEGQMIALDMIFAPPEFMRKPPTPIWKEIQYLAPKIMNKKTASFLG